MSATHYLEKARLASALPAHKVAEGRDKTSAPDGKQPPPRAAAGATTAPGTTPPTPPPSAPTAYAGTPGSCGTNGQASAPRANSNGVGADVGAKSGRFAIRRSSLLCQDDRR